MKDKAQSTDEKLRQRVRELESSRTRLERALELEQKDNAMAQALLESASDGVVVVDGEGEIVLVNPRAAEMFGYRQGELLGQSIETLLPARLHDVHAEHREGYVSQPHPRPMGVGLDLVGRRKDGAEFPVEVSLSYTQVEGETFVMSFITDITDRKRAEKKLQQTLAALRKRTRDLALLNKVGQTLTATLDSKQVIKQLLQAVTEIIGAEGSSVWLWDEEQPGWLVCRAAFHRNQPLSLVNLRLPPGHGIVNWVAQHGKSIIVPHAPEDDRFAAQVDLQTGFRTSSLLAVPLRVRDEVIGALEVVNKLEGELDKEDQSLVEIMAASAAIAIHNAQLVEALRQHAKELQVQNEELDAFAHTVAHDLKNPLGILAGFAKTLEQEHDTVLPEELTRYLRIIAQNGRKASNIVDELLLLASVRKAEVEINPLDMGEILEEALGRFSDMIRERRAEIIKPPKQAWPQALGYAAWVEEIWVNYLSNAIRYGGQPPRVELGFDTTLLKTEVGQRAADERVTVTDSYHSRVRFWVRDNGPGISPEDQARLFTPFTQLHQVRTEGHGLGLSIVRRIAEKLDGQVGVESELGHGSTFYFALPRAPE